MQGPVHLASARVYNGPHSSIVAEKGYSQAFPLTAPYCHTQHNRKQFFNRDVDTIPALRELQLEPFPTRREGPTTPRTGSV